MNNTSSTNNRINNHVSTVRRSLGLAGVLGCSMLLSACDHDDRVEAVGGQIDLIDKRQATLLSGDLEAINGTYGANCTDRAGDWSVAVSLGATLEHAELSVVMDDTDCELTMTELQTSLGGTIEAIPAIDLAVGWAADPSSFGDPIDFYANASMDSVSFDSDFVISLLYSDDSTLADADGDATFELVETSVDADSVQAPQYSIDTSGLLVLVNSEQVVQSATGSIDLSLGMGAVAGQSYMVLDASGLDTFAELDAAFIMGTPVAIGDPPASDFTLVGEDLDAPVVRTLIIANIQEGVAAYQAFEITFHPAM